MHSQAKEKRGAKHPAQSPARVSPAMRIYRHALESVLGMLELCDLSRALAVSRAWSAAVRSMKPIHATIHRHFILESSARTAFSPLPPIVRLVVSPLLRHLAGIHLKGVGRWSGVCSTPLNNESLALLSQHAPNLQSLRCVLTLTPTESVVLPAKLQSLELQLGSDASYPAIKYADAVINGVLTTVAALPSLSRLHLCLAAFRSRYGSSVDLSLLSACRSLTDLALEHAQGSYLELSDTQVEQIRFLSGIWIASRSHGWGGMASRVCCSRPSLRDGGTSDK